MYKSSTNNLSILTSLNELRLENVLCDVVLVVEEDKFVAHRNVLTASSSFFKNLFESNDKASEVCINTSCTENFKLEKFVLYFSIKNYCILKRSLELFVLHFKYIR